MTAIHPKNALLMVTEIETVSTGDANIDAQFKLVRVRRVKMKYFIGEQQVSRRDYDELRHQYRVGGEDPSYLPLVRYKYTDNVVVSKARELQYLYFYDPTTLKPVDLQNKVIRPLETST